MLKGKWLPAGTIMRVQAINIPNKVAVKDKFRQLTFKEWNDRSNRLSNALASMGVEKGDKFAILAYNCIEWMEIYAAASKGGQVAVPINFRLAGPEIEYIVNHSESKAFIVAKEFTDTIDRIRPSLNISTDRYVLFGTDVIPDGWKSYEKIIADASPEEPPVLVDGADPWMIMYTSGTTGKPKGVVRDHETTIAEFIINIIDIGFKQDDIGLLVMPMCHINSVFYSFVFTYIGASCYVCNLVSFDPEDVLRIIQDEKITFVSLVPTHYIMILSHKKKDNYDVSSMRNLVCSSAPVRRDTKLAIMDYFKGAKLFEIYGSTEAGSVTILKPEDQLNKLSSIGKEVTATDRIKILDEEGNEVPDGEVGELYARTPEIFTEYWKDPERTKKAFQGEWFSAGDMAKRDPDGFYYLVDRKANMIITGGENVFPSEVENVVGGHPAVKDVAVIGVPHEKWGEAVKAVVILHEGARVSEEELISHCRDKIAGYKVPKSIDFIKDEEMPRTATGKVLHRILRERYGKWSDFK
jgi:fatty-acyl-CoA synthase